MHGHLLNHESQRNSTHAVTTLRPKRFGEKGVRSGSIFFKTIYCFKGVGGTASSLAPHSTFRGSIYKNST